MPKRTIKCRKILVTSALPYANGPIHLGHLVEYIQTDIWTRFQKMRGHECYYVCADDAHGTAIMLKAEELGVTAEELIAQVHTEHEEDFQGFLIQFDNYYSTHTKRIESFQRLYIIVYATAGILLFVKLSKHSTQRKTCFFRIATLKDHAQNAK